MADSPKPTGELCWREFVKDNVLPTLTKSSEVERLDFLHNILLIRLQRQDISPDVLPALLHSIFLTYPRYHDRASRAAILDVLRALNAWDSPVFQKTFVPALVKEAERIGRSTSDGNCVTPASERLVLLTWVDLLVACTLESDPESVHVAALIQAQALLLDSIACSARPSIVQSAFREVRRTIRQVASHIPKLVDLALSNASTCTPPYRNAVFVGTVVDTSIRLKVASLNGKRMVEEAAPKLREYHLKNVVSSKTLVSDPAMNAFRDFVNVAVTKDLFESEYLPVIQKTMKGSPQPTLKVLSSIIPALAFDPSSCFANDLLEPILNCLQSSVAPVRESALTVWEALTDVSHDPESLQAMASGVTKLLTSGKVSSFEQRSMLCNALSLLSKCGDTSVCLLAVEGLLQMTSKESNEQALLATINSIGRHLLVLVEDESSSNAIGSIIKAFTKAHATSKPAIRKAWVSILGDALWAGRKCNATLNVHVEEYLKALFESLQKIIEKPLLWKDGPLEVYVLVASVSGRIQKWDNLPPSVPALLKKHDFPSSMLVTTPKPSFLFWSRVYTKALGTVEGIWFVRAITSLFAQESTSTLDSSGAGRQCAQALIWVTTSHPEHAVRKAASEEMAALARRDPSKLSRFMTEALKQWLLDIEHNTKDTLAVTSRAEEGFKKELSVQRLASMLNAITSFNPSASPDAKEEELLALILFAHHEYIASPTDKYNWITLVQRAGIDPGKLVTAHKTKILDMLKAAFDSQKESMLFYKAACSAISTLVFIDSDLSDFVGLAGDMLDVTALVSLSDLDYNIWNTPEGTLFVDVLSKKTDDAARRRMTKDELWDEQLREEMAKKHSTTRKLTKEEEKAVAAQRDLEDKVRANVQSVHDNIELGLHIIDALVTGTRHNVSNSMGRLVDMLLNSAKSGAGRLVGDHVVNTFLALGLCLSEKLYSIREAIGLASLRVNNVSYIPPRWMEEPVQDIVSRVLYRLRFVTEAQPLQPDSFVYVFPVLHQVTHSSGSGEIYDEQMTMAADVIGFHCGCADSALMPREEIVETLLHIIRKHPGNARNARASLETLCQAMESAAAEDTEGLQIRDAIDALLAGLLSEEIQVREAALKGLEYLDLVDIDYSPELWLACHDKAADNAALAKALWEENALEVDEHFKERLLDYAVSDSAYCRSTANVAIAEAIKIYPDTVTDVVNTVYDLYKKKAESVEPKLDKFGLIDPATLNLKDPWESRVGLALVLKAVAPSIPQEALTGFCNFLIEQEVLGDRDENVRKQMLEAGLAVVNAHGKENAQAFLAAFEAYLNTKAFDNETHDYIRQAVVILYGAAAGFLDAGDAKVPMAVSKLIETLATPSEVVQSAVADCLPPLIKMNKEEAPKFCKSLMDTLFHGDTYAKRRGAAYGLAGVVKGRGISALKEYSIMSSLEEAAVSKKDYKYRQGAFLAFEIMSATLGRLFEPYITKIIPLLLLGYGDAKSEVCEASADTARVIMSKISGHCVKLILPAILEGLEDRKWRTKRASVELLGATAYCAPKQLMVSLHDIIPRITEAMADTHSSVQAAAKQSLSQFGDVINNPEIKALVPILLGALSDPKNKSAAALDALLTTSFAHYIDSPSLALVMPILERGLREKDTKVKSAQIVGNMASLTEQKDLVPHLALIQPRLMEVLADPTPKARGTAAKSLANLVEKLGENNFPNLVDQLDSLLLQTNGGVEQQGAAQGLAEVLAAIGLERLESILPHIIRSTEDSSANVRESFIYLLVYLPATFGARLHPYLDRIIAPILTGLADESDEVREVSLRAGRMIVNEYASKAVNMLLPELEKGLMDANWRIRQSSVKLVGELLFRVTGITNPFKASQALGNMDELDDKDEPVDYNQVDSQKKKLVDILGKERNDRILAALYLVRHDASGQVRQGTLQVWKALVPNTPRTLKDILPILMSLIVQNLASEHYDQRMVAAGTLRDLVEKLGEGLLPSMLAILEKGIKTVEEDVTRLGTMVALSEVMEVTDQVLVRAYSSQITTVIKTALSDTSSDVRKAGALAFDTFHQHVGGDAIDSVLPALLHQLQSSDESSTYALAALKDIMAVKANVVFPVLIPTLIKVPITASNASALTSLVTVAGPALNRRLHEILRALIKSRLCETDENTLEQLLETTRALLISVDEDGLDYLMETLMKGAASQEAAERDIVNGMVETFYAENGLSADEYYYELKWIHRLVLFLEDKDPKVVQSAWSALKAVTDAIPKGDCAEDAVVDATYHVIKQVGAPGKDVAGFCLPKGISPILSIFLQGLMGGSPSAREKSASGIGLLVDKTSTDALKPFVTQMAGPLIRVAGEKSPHPVKVAILETLCVLLRKAPAFLKPFLPQLQRTFNVSLMDPASDDEVRSVAVSALDQLIPLLPRVDQFVTELVTKMPACEPEAKRNVLDVLATVVTTATIAEKSKESIVNVIADTLQSDDASLQAGAKHLLSKLAATTDLKDTPAVIQDHL